MPRELPATAVPTEEERILDVGQEHGSITNAESQKLLGVSAEQAKYLLRKLVESGALSDICKAIDRHRKRLRKRRDQAGG